MNILILKDNKSHYSHIYRRLLPAYFMQKNGVCEYRCTPGIHLDSNGNIDDGNVDWADIVLFHLAQGGEEKLPDGKVKRHPNSVMVRKLKEMGKRTSYDGDDLYFDLPIDGVRFPKWVVEDTKQVIRDVDMVSCASNFLKEMFIKYTGVSSDKITVIPNYVLKEEYDLEYADLDNQKVREAQNKEGVVRIGIMGGNNHIKDHLQVIPILEQIKKIYGDKVQFEVFGLSKEYLERMKIGEMKSLTVLNAIRAYDEMEKLGFIFHSPNENRDEFPREMCRLGWDIGLAMISNNRTDKSKSFLKWMDYSMAHIAGVYRGIPPYTDVVKNNMNGMLATTFDEWVKKISYLIDNPQARERIVFNSRQRIGGEFDINVGYHVWADFFRRLNGKD